jgi:hypothetical protein
VAALRPGIPRNLTDAIQRALSKEPSERFPTMEAFAEAVRGGAAGTADATTPLPTPAAAIPATIRTERRSRVPLVALAALVLAAVSLAAFFGLRGRNRAVPPGPVDTATIAQIGETTRATPQSTATAFSRDIPETTVTPPPRTQDTSPAVPPLRTTPTRAERPAPAAAIGADGYLEIDSDPTAELYVDGVDMGSTPMFHHRVSSGQHALRLEVSGYKTQRVAVQVEPGRTFTKTYKLNPE